MISFTTCGTNRVPSTGVPASNLVAFSKTSRTFSSPWEGSRPRSRSTQSPRGTLSVKTAFGKGRRPWRSSIALFQ